MSSNTVKTNRILIVDMRGSQVFEDKQIKKEQMRLNGKREWLRDERRKLLTKL